MAIYYIDPSSPTNGSGTETDPKNTWAGLTWAAGNAYLQKAGTTFSGAVTVGASGSDGAVITVGKYGVGDDPIITQGSSGQTFSMAGRSYVTVEDLDIRNTKGISTTDNALYLSSIAGTNLILRRLTLRSAAYGINIAQQVSNIEIDSCNVIGGEQKSIYFYGNPSSNITVKNCFCKSIRIRYANNVTVTGNNVQNTQLSTDAIAIENSSGVIDLSDNIVFGVTGSAYGINIATCTFSGFIENNVVSYNGQTGIRLLATSGNILLIYNMSSGNIGNGYYFDNSNGLTLLNNSAIENFADGFVTINGCYNVTFSFCISERNGNKALDTDGDGFTSHGTDRDIFIYHCLSIENICSGFAMVGTSSGKIYNSISLGNAKDWSVNGGVDQVRGGFFFGLTANNAISGTSWDVKNCISVGNYPVEMHLSAVGKTLVQADYNCYLPLGMDTLATLDGLVTNISWESYHTTYEAHSINADPLFLSDTDYHLQLTSPCLNAGTSISGISTDLDGNQYPSPNGASIGPYEDYPLPKDGFGPWAHFDGTMPTLEFSDTAPAKLKSVTVTTN